jgi:hypothetical protein
MVEIDDYFTDGRSPFAKIGGYLSIETGKDDFIRLQMHEEILSIIRETIVNKPISIRLFLGRIGEGKSWTLSWVWREMEKWHDKGNRTLVLGIPRVELRGTPERALAVGILLSMYSQKSRLVKSLEELNQAPAKDIGPAERYVMAAIKDDESFSKVIGASARLPTIGDTAPPIRSPTEGSTSLIMGVFRIAKLMGYSSVLILVDEAETLFTAYGGKNLMLFSNFVRNLYDELESRSNGMYPTVEILLSGTHWVQVKLRPPSVEKQRESGDIVEALKRRMDEDIILPVPKEQDIEKIAEERIGRHRLEKYHKPFIPYDKEAIQYVWANCDSSMGTFVKYLHRMYENALLEHAEKITKKHATDLFNQPDSAE